MAMNQSDNLTIDRNGMTSLIAGMQRVQQNSGGQNAWEADRDTAENTVSAGDIPVSEITTAPGIYSQLPTGSSLLNENGFAVGGGVNEGFAGEMGTTYPQILPTNPTFTVPANPLLPDEYNEILDYNSLQYLNGIFRTQIGRYVRVQQLVGSNTLQDFDGFLIGVGINYIILQEYSNSDIRILDIYGIKQMYVYYSEIRSPFLDR